MQVVKQDVKSMLARLLATENITIQQKPGSKTAAFDLKNRVLYLPVWNNVSNDLQDLLLGHETGHALDTPPEKYKEAVESIAKKVHGPKSTPQHFKNVAGFLNVIEDARIDKRQKRRYPGLKRNFLYGYKELFDRNFFGTNNRPLESFNFIDRANLYFKGGNVHLDLSFEKDEKLLLKKIEDLETFEDVISVTEEAYRFCKDQIEQQLNEMDSHGYDDSEDSDGDGEYGDDYDYDYDDSYDSDGDSSTSDYSEGDEGSDEEDSDSGEGDSGEADDVKDSDKESGKENKQSSDANSDKKKNQKTNSKSSGDKNKKEDKKEQSESNVSKSGSNAGKGTDDLSPSSDTDNVYQEKVKSLAQNDSDEYIYVSFPEVKWNQAVNDYKVVLKEWKTEIVAADKRRYSGVIDASELEKSRKKFFEWRMKEKEIISFMVSEFERKKAAETYARTSTARTGVLDMLKIHSYKHNEDLFKRINTIPKGKNHGFVMFIDWSGSMKTNLEQTLKQLFSLALFCKQIQVPFDVYGFKDSNTTSPFKKGQSPNCINFNRVVLRNYLSSRMNTEEFNFACSVLWGIGSGFDLHADILGGTPLNEAIVLAEGIVNDFRKKNHLEIVNTVFLTDGDSNHVSSALQNDTKPYHDRWKKRHYFFNDPKTGKTYELDGFGAYCGGSNNNFTSSLLKILRDRTESNLIGFYLTEGSFGYVTRRFKLSSCDSKAKKFWNENKFYPIKSEGYDEYYVIDSDAMADTRNILDIKDSNVSTKQMAKAFTEFANKKTVNRVLLRQFIHRVSGEEEKKKRVV